MLSHHTWSPRAPLINVVAQCMPASELEMAVFFEGLSKQSDVTTLNWGKGGMQVSSQWVWQDGCFFWRTRYGYIINGNKLTTGYRGLGDATFSDKPIELRENCIVLTIFTSHVPRFAEGFFCWTHHFGESIGNLLRIKECVSFCDASSESKFLKGTGKSRLPAFWSTGKGPGYGSTLGYQLAHSIGHYLDTRSMYTSLLIITHL